MTGPLSVSVGSTPVELTLTSPKSSRVPDTTSDPPLTMSSVAPASIVRLLTAVAVGPESPVVLSIVTVTAKPITIFCHTSGAQASLQSSGQLQLPSIADSQCAARG